MYRTVFKPLIDKLAAAFILLVFSPILIFISLMLALVNRGNIWFIQPRPGKNERIFNLIKFKTMTDYRNQQGELLSDEKRLTGLGKLIRATSIDELPQLINVLKGDMSLVGPRPLLVEYLELYSTDQRRRHEVVPGITGWAQINGRNAISWEQKFELDVWYVKNQSFWLDVKILILTVLKVFKAEGISSKNSITMEKFRGNS